MPAQQALIACWYRRSCCRERWPSALPACGGSSHRRAGGWWRDLRGGRDSGVRHLRAVFRAGDGAGVMPSMLNDCHPAASDRACFTLAGWRRFILSANCYGRSGFRTFCGAARWRYCAGLPFACDILRRRDGGWGLLRGVSGSRRLMMSIALTSMARNRRADKRLLRCRGRVWYRYRGVRRLDHVFLPR